LTNFSVPFFYEQWLEPEFPQVVSRHFVICVCILALDVGVIIIIISCVYLNVPMCTYM
jgi:hypothetical protein